jgi:hypothetical protein
MEVTTPPRLAAALEYEALGWSVLPLCPHNHVAVGKAHRGCQSPGKRPFFPNKAEGAQGEWKEFQTRRATAAEIEAQHAAHPDLNVGVALGPVSGMVAVDVDDDDGDKLLFDLAGGEIPPTWEYSTGKGRRLLFALPDGVSVLNHQFRRPGTEIEILRFMSAGGQVVLPPSRHPNGAVYRWKAGRGPTEIPAAVVPEWMRAAKVPDGAERSRPADGELIGEGGRNSYLTSLAGAMRKRGADEDVIFAALERTNETRFDPPLAEAEVRTVARSVARYRPDEFSGVTFRVPPPDGVPKVAGDRRFKWSSELSAPDKADEWLWTGYLPRAGITLISAHAKAGKTTLLSHFLPAAAESGTFLGQPIRATRILLVSEEGESHWVRRRDKLGIGDHVGYYLQPFPIRPTPVDWVGFIQDIRKDVEAHKFDLVVFDTIAKLWPVREENAAGEVDEALMPLWELTKAGAAVLLFHHLKKMGGQEFTGARGSGALAAFPDILVELTRFDAADAKCHKRKLTAKGRYDETPDELVIELDGGRYRAVSDPVTVTPPAAAGQPVGITIKIPDGSKEEQAILSVLRDSGEPWMTTEQIRLTLKERGAGTRYADVTTHLFSLYERSQVVVRGEPRSKSNPRRYALSGRADVVPESFRPLVSDGNDIGNETGDEAEGGE